MEKKQLKELVSAFNIKLKGLKKNKVVYPEGSDRNASIRFELYHCGKSLCSQKVRMTLAVKGLPYKSHDLSIVPSNTGIQDNYQPEYIKIRLAAVDLNKVKLVSGFNGGSAVSSQGFDPAVVPTLVDLEEGRVIVDSAKICEYIQDNVNIGPDLKPSEFSEKINTHMKIVDDSPHVALLYGANPRGDSRPWITSIGIKGIHEKKIKSLKKAMESVKDDQRLLTAYEAKIAKESAAESFIENSDQMGTVVDRMKDGILQLEKELRTHKGSWACGTQFTLADIFWAVSLFRMKWIGIGYLFDPESECPNVTQYAERLFENLGFRNAVFDWPGAYGPSPYVPEMNSCSFKAAFYWNLITNNEE